MLVTGPIAVSKQSGRHRRRDDEGIQLARMVRCDDEGAARRQVLVGERNSFQAPQHRACATCLPGTSAQDKHCASFLLQVHAPIVVSPHRFVPLVLWPHRRKASVRPWRFESFRAA